MANTTAFLSTPPGVECVTLADLPGMIGRDPEVRRSRFWKVYSRPHSLCLLFAGFNQIEIAIAQLCQRVRRVKG